MAVAHDVTLPGGLWIGGGRRRDAAVRALTGEDEAFLLDAGAQLSPAHRSTALLARCVVRLGAEESVGAEAVRALDAGDRQALLLELRRATFGDRLECVLSCPACGEALDLDLRVGDLLVAPYPDRPTVHEADLGGAVIRFRVPAGADEEAAALVARSGEEAAAAVVLRRCVTEGESVDDDTAAALGELMGELDPQADFVLELVCAACGEAVSAPFDAGDYLARELAANRGALLGEIHVLALHYGWAESELMAMTPKRRRRYVDHLVEELSA